MYLLDTDTLIYFLKGHKTVVENFKRHALSPKALSVITYGELVYGAHKSQQTLSNLAKVRRLVELYPVFDISKPIMESFGEIKALLSTQGITVDDFDLQIGCTALTFNYTIVTNNQKHFQKIPNLRVENWTLRA
jgi:tRNA(fMet)-specific endonuclease VapC